MCIRDRSPVVQEAARAHLSGHDRIHLIEPLTPDEMHNVMARSAFVMTDSGGLQEEAPALGRPVLVLRRETERPEAVAAGTVLLAGTEEDVIYGHAARLLTDPAAYRAMAQACLLYTSLRRTSCQRRQAEAHKDRGKHSHRNGEDQNGPVLLVHGTQPTPFPDCSRRWRCV